MPTITGHTRAPGGQIPVTGTWRARVRTNVGAAIDDDGTIRLGEEAVTDQGDGADMTLPAGAYDFTFESLTRGPHGQIRLGPYAYELVGDSTWGDVMETPYEVPVTPSDVTRAEAARQGAETAASQAVAVGNTNDTIIAGRLDDTASNTRSKADALYDAMPESASTITKNDLRDRGVFLPELYGARGNGTADDTAAIQACIDAAQAAISGGSASGYGKVPTIHFYGRYRITSTIQWKSAHLFSSKPLDGGVIEWDGPANGTAIAKWGTAHTGGASYAGFEGLAMLPGGAEPGTWIDFTTAPDAQALVDKFGQVRDAQFGSCTSDAIRVGSWVNAHWSGLRFDSVGGYCVKLTPHADVNLASFAIDDFTYDHRRTTVPGKGVIGVDTTAIATGNLGVVKLSKGRIEHNLTNLDAKAGVFVVKTTAASGPRVGFELNGVTVANAAGVNPVPYLYRDVVSTTDRPDLLLTNVVSSTSPVLGGVKPANTADYPAGSYAHLDLNSGAMATTNLDVRAFAVGDQVMGVRQGADTQRRWAMTSDGRMDWSSGSSAPDARIYRPAAGVVGMLLGVWRDATGTTAQRPSASAVGAGAVYYDTDLGKPIHSNGSAWRDAMGSVV